MADITVAIYVTNFAPAETQTQKGLKAGDIDVFPFTQNARRKLPTLVPLGKYIIFH